MNELKVFQSNEFGELGIMLIDGKEYFPAIQCAKILGYADPKKAVKQHCNEKGWVICPLLTNGGVQNVKFINEGNLYRLIIRSKIPSATKFESWVFDELLPEIRRTGTYGQLSFEEMFVKALDERIENAVNKVLDEKVEAIVNKAVSETVKALSPFMALSVSETITETKVIKKPYKHHSSKIFSLSPEIRKQVDNMIISGEYSCQKIADFIEENTDTEISYMTISRYIKKYFILQK